jgi:hypothetical protein
MLTTIAMEEKPMSHVAQRRVALAVAAVLTPVLITGCIVQPAPVYRTVPQPEYAPPPPQPYNPPPAYNAPPPADEATEQAYQPPPPLPDYEQPPCPSDGYIWTPGYWHWSPAGYYWVPGTWVEPPAVGLLWTPGYWGFVGAVYVWHGGYWGPHVGFYGGVNYGYGYHGEGYEGGHWEGGRFAYNTAVTRVDTTIVHNTYVNNTVINNVTVNKISYNGGPNGVAAQPTPQQRQFAQEAHVPPTTAQVSHVQEARANPTLFANANGGHPPIAATPRPAAFSGPGVIAAHGAAITQPPGHGPQVPPPQLQGRGLQNGQPAITPHPATAQPQYNRAYQPQVTPSTPKVNAPAPKVYTPPPTNNAKSATPSRPKGQEEREHDHEH